MSKKLLAPVTLRSVIQRINRKLKLDNETLKATRGQRLRMQVGDYYVVDFNRNFILHTNVDPEQMGRELGVLHAWERVIDEQEEVS